MSDDLDVAGDIASNRHSIPANSSALGRMNFTGYTVGTTEYVGARVVGRSSQAWTSTAGGTRLEFEITEGGTLTPFVGMTLDAATGLTVAGTVVVDAGTVYTLEEFQQVVAASSDFADFQARVAAL